MLENVDTKLVEEFKRLPLDYWDFKGEDTRGLTHGIHNYPAVMVYPISRNLIGITKKHQKDIETLLDPFMGSGTVLVEGILSDMKEVYGNDLNPLAQLISKVKTFPLDIDDLNQIYIDLVEKIDERYWKYQNVLYGLDDFIKKYKIDITAKDNWGSEAPEIINQYFKISECDLKVPNFNNLGYWFKPKITIELQILKEIIQEMSENEFSNFIWVAYSETVRWVSNRRNGEFKMYRMTPQKVLDHNPNVKELFLKILKNNILKMEDFVNEYKKLENKPQVVISNDNTMDLTAVPDGSIDLMVTSPPYGDSRTTVAYGQYSRVSLQWLNMGLNHKEIVDIDKTLLGGTRPSKDFNCELPSEILKNSIEIIKKEDTTRAADVYAFYMDLDKSLETITKKMKINSYQYWVVGNRTVKGEKLLTDEIIVELGKQYNLKHVHTIPRAIPNKVMPSKNSPTNKPGDVISTMTNEHIVILRKEK
jgi:hypothetical protein